MKEAIKIMRKPTCESSEKPRVINSCLLIILYFLDKSIEEIDLQLEQNSHLVLEKSCGECNQSLFLYLPLRQKWRWILY